MRAKQRSKFWVDIILFAGFSLAFFLDLTGLSLHQFIGLGAGLLALYHLAAHWQWLRSVGQRLFDRACARPRLYFFLDAVLFAGFAYILGSGLVISTWLNLALADYETWRVVHIVVSALTMLALLAKLVLHWRWIANAAASLLPAPRPVQPFVPLPAAAPNPGRREFLRVMGVTTVVGVFALGKSLQSLSNTAAQLAETASQTPAAQPTAQAAAAAVQPTSAPLAAATSQPTPLPTSQPTAVVQPTAAPAAAACVVRCSKACSYPGRCRRYTDSNQNGRCDLGECL